MMLSLIVGTCGDSVLQNVPRESRGAVGLLMLAGVRAEGAISVLDVMQRAKRRIRQTDFGYFGHADGTPRLDGARGRLCLSPEGCSRAASFGVAPPGGRCGPALYCARHKEPDHVYVRRRRCEHPAGCANAPTHGEAGARRATLCRRQPRQLALCVPSRTQAPSCTVCANLMPAMHGARRARGRRSPGDPPRTRALRRVRKGGVARRPARLCGGGRGAARRVRAPRGAWTRRPQIQARVRRAGVQARHAPRARPLPGHPAAMRRRLRRSVDRDA